MGFHFGYMPEFGIGIGITGRIPNEVLGGAHSQGGLVKVLNWSVGWFPSERQVDTSVHLITGEALVFKGRV